MVSISYIDDGVVCHKERRGALQDGYYFNCECDRCLEQSKEESKIKIHNTFAPKDELWHLNMKALNFEREAKFEDSLKLVFLII